MAAIKSVKDESKIPERFIWANKLIDVKPDDHILEIGCGVGLLAEQLASKLTSGQLVAIDKSIKMLEKAKQRNRGFIDSGVMKFLSIDFSQSELPKSYFDTVVAFNVNLFWKDSAKEFKIIMRSLKPNGKLYVFHQAPYEIDASFMTPVKQLLEKNQFEVIDIKLKKLQPAAVCLVAGTKAVE